MDLDKIAESLKVRSTTEPTTETEKHEQREMLTSINEGARHQSNSLDEVRSNEINEDRQLQKSLLMVLSDETIPLETKAAKQELLESGKPEKVYHLTESKIHALAKSIVFGLDDLKRGFKARADLDSKAKLTPKEKEDCRDFVENWFNQKIQEYM